MHTVFTAEGGGATPKTSIHAHLLDEFDLDAVPIRTIDGKNLW